MKLEAKTYLNQSHKYTNINLSWYGIIYLYAMQLTQWNFIDIAHWCSRVAAYLNHIRHCWILHLFRMPHMLLVSFRKHTSRQIFAGTVIRIPGNSYVQLSLKCGSMQSIQRVDTLCSSKHTSQYCYWRAKMYFFLFCRLAVLAFVLFSENSVWSIQFTISLSLAGSKSTLPVSPSQACL